MAGFTDAVEARILNKEYGGTDYTPSADHFIALCTGVNEAGVITGEPVGNGYARAQVANNTTTWPTTVDGTKSNGIEISFPAATGPGWGTLTVAAVVTLASGGVVISYGTLDSPITVGAGVIVRFPIGNIDLSLD